MKRLFVLAFLLLTPFIVYLGCSNNNIPTTPPSSPVPTNTPGSPTDTPTHTGTYTPTYNPSFGTPTHTFTPGPSTPTATSTETPLCGSPYNFGKNYAGGSNSGFSPLNLLACRYNLPTSGRVTRLHVYCPNTIGPNIRMALYTNNGSAPQSLISQSSPQASVVGWNSVAIPGTAALPAGTYWIALVSDGTLGIAYDTGVSGDTQYQGVTFGPLPTAFTGGSSTDWNFSYYADYCVGPGTPTPVPTITWTPTWTFTPTPTITPSYTPLPACFPFTFGKNFVASSTLSGVSNNLLFAARYNLTASGSVTALNVYIPSNAGASIQMALYNNSGSNPTTMITSSNPQVSVIGWNHVVVPTSTALAPGTYWICLVAQSGFDLSNDMTGISGDGQYVSMVFGGAFPASFSGASFTDWAFSGFADYCVGPGTPTPLPSITWTFTPSFTPTFTPTFTQTPVPGCNGSYNIGTNWPLSAHGVFNNYGSMFANKVNLTVGGRVTSLHFLSGAAGGNVQMALYSNSAGAPNTLITSSSSQAAVSGVNDVDVPDTGDLPVGTYWVVAMPAYNTGIDFYNEYVGNPSNGFWMNNSGTFPATTAGGADQGYNFSIWASHCVMGASPTPIPWTATPTNTSTPTATPTETAIPGCTPGTAGVTIAQSPTGGNNYFHSSKFSLAATRKIVGLHCYTHAAGGTFQMAIYNDSSGAPNNLLTYSGVVTAGIGWNNVPIPGTGALVAGTYWIATICNGVDFSYNSSGPAGSGYFIFLGTVGYPFPNPASGGSNTTNIFSFYVDTCP